MTPPTRYALVPKMWLIPADATEKMGDYIQEEIEGDCCREGETVAVANLAAASPNGGAVSAVDLERAAEAWWESHRAVFERMGIPTDHWSKIGREERLTLCGHMCAALTVLGLPVADAPTEVVDAQES